MKSPGPLHSEPLLVAPRPRRGCRAVWSSAWEQPVSAWVGPCRWLPRTLPVKLVLNLDVSKSTWGQREGLKRGTGPEGVQGNVEGWQNLDGGGVT